MFRRFFPLPGAQALLATLALGAIITSPAAAQQRSIVNPGFEANDPAGPGAPNYEILPSASVSGWESSTGSIELWDSGFSGVPAYEGAVFAEMNADNPGALYQNICLVSGEVIRWTFAHRARSGGANSQTALFQVASSTGTVRQTLATQVSTIAQNAWNVNSSPTAGVVYTGTSGVQRLQFKTTDAGSFGNFLDGIHIYLSPYLELSGSSTSATEGAVSPTLPAIVISGEVLVATSVTVNVTGGTATRGVDYTTPNGAATFTVAIPAGSYNKTAFPLGLTIINDSAIEPNETIILNIASNPGSYTLASTGSCGTAATTTLTHTIIDDDSRLTLRKQWSAAKIGDDANVTVTRAGSVVRTFTSEAASANELDTDTISIPVVIGETLILGETTSSTNVGNYAGTIACTGAADTSLADGLTIATGETAVICTYTNVFRIPLIVSKTSAPVSDPANGTTNPKMIPGALLDYTIVVTNPGGPINADTIVINDPLPAGLCLLIGDVSGVAGSGPVAFTDGPPSSALSYSFSSLASLTDDLDFSNNGGASWAYVPAAAAVSGCDPAVTAIRVRPKGTMATNGSVKVRFRTAIQ